MQCALCRKKCANLRSFLVERQSYLGKNQDLLAEMHITQKQLKNAHAVDSKDTKSYGFGEAACWEREVQGHNRISLLVSSPLKLV